MPGSVYENPLWHTFLLLPFFSLVIVVYSRGLILTVSDDLFDELKFKLNNKTEKRLKKARMIEKQVYEHRNERDDKWTEECTISGLKNVQYQDIYRLDLLFKVQKIIIVKNMMILLCYFPQLFRLMKKESRC